MKKLQILLFAALFFLCSCAARYNAINPTKVKYPDVQVKDESVVLQYKYEVLQESENKKHAKKEQKFGVNLVAVKITNNTDSVIYTNDLEYLSGSNSIIPLSPSMTKKMLRQRGEYHLFYLLFTPMRFYSGTSSTPIGIVVGPGLTLLNMGIARAANMAMIRNLEKYSLKDRAIKPGTSIYGLAGFPNRRGDPIYVRIKKIRN